MEGVAPGWYTVLYSKDGYGSNDIARLSRIEVPASGDPLKLEMQMDPLARIAGRVLDERGEPISLAKLELIDVDARSGQEGASRAFFFRNNVAYSAGQRQSYIADGDGQFSLGNLRPGTYIISAAVPANFDPPPPLDGKDRAWIKTYYPKVGFREGALKILLRPGMETGDVEIRMQAVAVRHVRGTVLGPKDEPAANAILKVAENVTVSEDGQFDLSLFDGEWKIAAQKSDDEIGVLRGAEVVRVSGRDVEGIKLRMVAPVAVTGTIIYDPPLDPKAKKDGIVIEINGKEYRKPVDAMLPRLALVSTEAGGRGAAELEVNTVPGEVNRLEAYPGTYSVEVSDDPPYFVDSIRVGGRELLDRKLSVVAPVSLDVILRKTGGGLSGKVEQGKDCSVLAQPMDSVTVWANRTVTCDEKGNYRFEALRPGEYLVWAVGKSDLERLLGAIMDQQVTPYVGKAVRVRIPANDKAALDLKMMVLE